MKAKDTVMKELVYDSGLVVKFSITEREIAETQAEVSFEAGIKEVVDWMEKNPVRWFFNTNETAKSYEAKWQKQLKEWFEGGI